jgi:F-type H+-transporting ATPase subunit epsilon
VAAGRLTLTVVTPEHAVVDRALCDEVTLPSLAGEIGILPGHTPLITLLGIGVVGYRDGAARGAVAVREGFAEISADHVRVLADRAVSRESVDAAAATRDREAAEKRRLDVVGEEELQAVNADQAFAEARLKIAAAPGA